MACVADIASTVMPLRGGCGFPSVRLDGSFSDWYKLGEKLRELQAPFDRSSELLGGMAGIADEIARLLRAGDEAGLQRFMRDFIRSSPVKTCESGHVMNIRGWIGTLYGKTRSNDEDIDVGAFPHRVAKVIWEDVRTPDQGHAAIVGILGSIDDDEGVPVPQFGQASFTGPVAAVHNKFMTKRSLARAVESGEVLRAVGAKVARAQIPGYR